MTEQPAQSSQITAERGTPSAEAGDRPRVAQKPAQYRTTDFDSARPRHAESMSQDHIQKAVVVDRDGTLQTLYDELLDLTAFGLPHIERASHVEPTSEGVWTADLSPVGGPTLGPYLRRSQALAAEVSWIDERILS